MNPVWLIARRELQAYLRSFSGYVILAAVLGIDALLFNAYALEGVRRSAEVLSRFFYFASGTTMVASVFIAMRLLAEERQAKTLPLLYSAPISGAQLVGGKFLSAFCFVGLMTLLTAFMPALIWVNGKVSLGHLAAGYLGLLLLGSASVALTTLSSALAKNQVLAAVLSGFMLVGLLVSWLLASVTDRPFSQVFTALALHGVHFQPFQNGIIHLRDVAYYLLLTWVALFAATRVVEARRWQ